MNVLIVGGGAREQAICNAIYRSKKVDLYSGMKNLNPGIEKRAVDYSNRKFVGWQKGIILPSV